MLPEHYNLNYKTIVNEPSLFLDSSYYWIATSKYQRQQTTRWAEDEHFKKKTITVCTTKIYRINYMRCTSICIPLVSWSNPFRVYSIWSVNRWIDSNRTWNFTLDWTIFTRKPEQPLWLFLYEESHLVRTMMRHLLNILFNYQVIWVRRGAKYPKIKTSKIVYQNWLTK